MESIGPAGRGRETSRREFLAASASIAGAGALGSLPLGAGVHVGGSGAIRAGLIGCGGRGTDAAINAMNAGEDVRIVALADIFPDRLEESLRRLKERKPA